MGEVFKEASDCFKARQKVIDDYHKKIAVVRKMEEKAWKAAEHHAKRVEAEAKKARAQAVQGGTHGRGRGSQAHGHACGRGRVPGGRGGGVAAVTMQWSDSCDSEGQTSDSDSTVTHNDDNIPMPETTIAQPEGHLPRACRAWAPICFPDEVEE